LKCPKCNEDMMILCRRDSHGFLNELYYKCLACGYIPTENDQTLTRKPISRKSITFPKMKFGNLRWKIGTTAILATLVLATVMQIPVPVRVFAAETSIDPLKDILPYINLVNFTVSRFSLNYTEGEIILQISADYASIKSTETSPNVTTCNIIIGKVLVNYKDSQRTLNMGFASLNMAVTIKYQELIAKINGTAYLPLWTAILDRLTGKLP